MAVSKEAAAAYQRGYREKNRAQIAAQRAAFRAENKARLFEQKRAYRERNKDQIAAKKKHYRALNKDRISARDRALYESNRAERMARARDYYRANPERYRSLRGRRRAQEQQAKPRWCDEVAVHTGYMVAAALRSVGLPVEVDHLVPLVSDSVSGLHTHDNLTIVLKKENRAKSNSHWPAMWDNPNVG